MTFKIKPKRKGESDMITHNPIAKWNNFVRTRVLKRSLLVFAKQFDTRDFNIWYLGQDSAGRYGVVVCKVSGYDRCDALAQCEIEADRVALAQKIASKVFWAASVAECVNHIQSTMADVTGNRGFIEALTNFAQPKGIGSRLLAALGW
jgi:hypothetical protein